MRMDRTTQRGAWIKNGMFICKLRERAAARKGKDYQLGWALIMQYQTKRGYGYSTPCNTGGTE